MRAGKCFDGKSYCALCLCRSSRSYGDILSVFVYAHVYMHVNKANLRDARTEIQFVSNIVWLFHLVEFQNGLPVYQIDLPAFTSQNLGFTSHFIPKHTSCPSTVIRQKRGFNHCFFVCSFFKKKRNLNVFYS